MKRVNKYAINSHAIEYRNSKRVRVGENESVESKVHGGMKAGAGKASRLPAELVCMIAAHVRDSERLDMRRVCRAWAAALPVTECYRDLGLSDRLRHFEHARDPNRGVEVLITPEFAADHTSEFLHAYVRTYDKRRAWQTLSEETIQWLGLARLPICERVDMLFDVSRDDPHSSCSCKGPCVVMCELFRVLGLTAADLHAYAKRTHFVLEYAAYEGSVGVMRALLHMGVGAEYARMHQGGVVAEACHVGSLKALKCLVREFGLNAHDLLTLGMHARSKDIHTRGVGWTLDYTFRFQHHRMLRFLVREVGITREQVRAAAETLRSPWDYGQWL
jgi:hypothetical protein